MALSGCRHGELARRLLAGDREGARAVAEGYARLFGRSGRGGRAAGAAGRAGRRARRVRPGALPPPPARRRLARGGDGPARRGAGPAGRRHERRPLRSPGGPRAPRRAHGHPPRALGRDARRAPDAERRALPEVGPRARRAAARGRRRRSGHGGRLARGDRGRRRAGGGLPGRPCLRAVPLPRLPGAGRRDGLLVPRRALPRRHPAALSPRDAAGREAARPRARRHRAHRPRRVLPHLLGPHALREGAPHSRPGPRQRRRLDRGLRAGDHPGRPHPPQPPLRAIHQRGPHDLPGRRHRLQLGAPRGGDPVRLRALRRRAHGDGLQPRDLPGPERGPRGRDRPRVPAPARGSRGEGARDVRLGDGPPRPRDGRRLRRVLPAARRAGGGRRRAARGGARPASRLRRARRAARARRPDGPARPGRGGRIPAGRRRRDGLRQAARRAPGDRSRGRPRPRPARDITPSIKGRHPADIQRPSRGRIGSRASEDVRRGPVRAASRSAEAIRGDGIGGSGSARGADHDKTLPANGGSDTATSWLRPAPPVESGRLARPEDAARRGILPGTGSAPAIRAGGASDDKGGPGDSPASVAWLVRGGPDADTVRAPGQRSAEASPVGLARHRGRPSAGTPSRGPWAPPRPERSTGWGGPALGSRAAATGNARTGRRGPVTGTRPPRRLRAPAPRHAVLVGGARCRGVATLAPRGEHGRDVAVGALAGAVRPDRRLPPPPLASTPVGCS